jgi:hypothetical protein
MHTGSAEELLICRMRHGTWNIWFLSWSSGIFLRLFLVSS